MYVVSGTMFSLSRKLISNEGCLLHAFFCSSSAILDTPGLAAVTCRQAEQRERAKTPEAVTVTWSGPAQ